MARLFHGTWLIYCGTSPHVGHINDCNREDLRCNQGMMPSSVVVKVHTGFSRRTWTSGIFPITFRSDSLESENYSTPQNPFRPIPSRFLRPSPCYGYCNVIPKGEGREFIGPDALQSVQSAAVWLQKWPRGVFPACEHHHQSAGHPPLTSNTPCTCGGPQPNSQKTAALHQMWVWFLCGDEFSVLHCYCTPNGRRWEKAGGLFLDAKSTSWQ